MKRLLYLHEGEPVQPRHCCNRVRILCEERLEFSVRICQSLLQVACLLGKSLTDFLRRALQA